MMQPFFRFIFFVLAPGALITACQTVPFEPRDGAPSTVPVNIETIPEPTPKDEPYSRYGNPDTYEVLGKRYTTLKSHAGFRENGLASWYGTKFHGRLTSSGEPYNMYALTAAHKTLPIPSYARVTNSKNGKSIIVRINDRGPFHDDRILDLSYAAAIKLGVTANGTAPIDLESITVETEPSKIKNVSPVLNADNSELYVQVGAYRSEENAVRMRNQIQKASLVHSIKVAQVKKEYNIFYRVRIGPLPSREEAESVTAALNQIGIQESQIIAE